MLGPKAVTFADVTDLPQAMVDERVTVKTVRISGLPTGDDYDPFAHTTTPHPTSFWGTTFNLIFLSAGSMAFFVPQKFVEVGMGLGCALMALVFVLYVHSMHSVLRSAYRTCRSLRVPEITYADLVYRAFDGGPPPCPQLAPFARALVLVDFVVIWYNASVFLYQLMVDYAMTICSSLPYTRHLSRNAVLVAFLVPTLAAACVRRLKYLEPLSAAGFVLSVACLLPILYQTLVADLSPWQWPSAAGSVQKIPVFLGSMLVMLNATGMIIPLRHEMKHPCKFTQPFGVLTIAYSCIALVYYIYAFVFVAKCGVNVPENIISVLPPTQLWSQITLAVYVVALFLLYPLVLYVPFDVIWNDFLRKKRDLVSDPLKWEYALRITLVVASFALAYLNPDLSLFFTISGTVGTSIDSIIFPAVVQTLVEWRHATSWPRFAYILCKNIVICLVGVGLVVVGIKASFDASN